MNLHHDVIEGFYKTLEKSRSQHGIGRDTALIDDVLTRFQPVEQFLERVESDYRRIPRGISIDREIQANPVSATKVISLIAKDSGTLLQWRKTLLRFGAYRPSYKSSVTRWSIGFFNTRDTDKNIDGWYPSITVSHGWKAVRTRSVSDDYVGYELDTLPELTVLDVIGQLAHNIGIAETGLLARMHDGAV